jgi:hypothetical protein
VSVVRSPSSSRYDSQSGSGPSVSNASPWRAQKDAAARAQADTSRELSLDERPARAVAVAMHDARMGVRTRDGPAVVLHLAEHRGRQLVSMLVVERHHGRAEVDVPPDRRGLSAKRRQDS